MSGAAQRNLPTNDFSPPAGSMADSGLRNRQHAHHPPFSYPQPYPPQYQTSPATPYHHVVAPATSHNAMDPQFQDAGNVFDKSEYAGMLSTTFGGAFSGPLDGQDLLSEQDLNIDFSHMATNQPFGPQLSPFPSCNDCAPASVTSIPHHHHASGRLPGASAQQLDGHFCCCWLTHDQPCFLCFNTAEDLDHHIKADHAGKDGTYRCMWQDCCKHDESTNTSQSVNFGNKPKLMRHVHSHTGYKPFPCPYPGCDKGFVTKEQLRNHETTHTKSRKHCCDLCGKAFAVKSALTTHITAVHEEKKTHKCDMCGKAFADSSNLSKHKQTHFRTSGVTKQRRGSKRDTSHSGDGTSTRTTTPHLPTPTRNSASPTIQIPSQHSRQSSIVLVSPLPSKMLPTSHPKLVPAAPFFSPPPVPQARPTTSATCSSALSTISSTSSPPPADAFDPDCYCCEQNCPQPDCPPSPCANSADDCDRAGFCDLPGCLDGPLQMGEACSTTLSTPITSVPATVRHDGDDSDQYLSQQQVQALRQFGLHPPISAVHAGAKWMDFPPQQQQYRGGGHEIPEMTEFGRHI